MCGIAGAIDVSANRAEANVSALNAAQWHRGPDHNILKRIGNFTLGNTRLAIQDPSPTGNQPFVSADGRYHCVFNGEIYNHRDLVERFGLPVRTTCDGEVIPHLWSKLGVAALAELRGMFAVALVDSLEDILYLARDPFGIKPLYWRMASEGLLFASEPRPLGRLAGGARIDSDAIARYLHLGAVAADRSPFLEISALPPNSVAVFGPDRRGELQQIFPAGSLPVAREPEDLGSALTKSIELHLGADVPTALLLSAGVDSATIAAVGRSLGRDLDCLTVATEGGMDESSEAADTARHYRHRFQQIPASLKDGDADRFFKVMQRPTIDGLNTYVVSHAVQEAGFKVALSGLGGDEAVGGYSHFRLLRYLPALRALDRMPGPVNRAATAILAGAGLASEAKLRRLLTAGGPREGWGLSLLQREVFPGQLVAELTGVRFQGPQKETAPGILHRLDPFSTMVAAEVAMYLQATLLPDADAFSMASSVELRVPFVDPGVLSASLALAARTGCRPGKRALGVALEDQYLSGLASRPKRGFSLPMKRWMSGPLAPVLHAANERDAPVWSVVDRAAAERAGLVPLRTRDRWAETWAVAALNGWLLSVEHDIPAPSGGSATKRDRLADPRGAAPPEAGV